MAAPIYHGTEDPVQQPTKKNWSADGGRIDTEVFAGKPSGISDKFDEDSASGSYKSVMLQAGADVSRMERVVEYATDVDLEEGVLSEKWQLKRNLVRRPLRSHPYFDPIGQGPYLDEVDAALKKAIAYDDIEFTGAGEAATTKEYYYYRAAGVEAYNYSTYVVTHIKKLADKTYIQAAEEFPNTVVDLPDEVPDQIIEIVDEDENGDAIEWLLQPVDVQPLEKGQYSASQEYWGGTPAWAKFYGGSWYPGP